MKYLAVLGRLTAISTAELEAQFGKVTKKGDLAFFDSDTAPDIDRLGGSIKIAEKLPGSPIDYLQNLPEGKITFGVSDYSAHPNARRAGSEAMKLKKILTRHGRSVRIVENKGTALSSATSLHNGLSGAKSNKLELIIVEKDWWRVVGIQDIDAYAKRDQARPARDAKVGMLPPKLAQILINLCGPLPAGSRILDPFCGTGVVLQEAYLMGYTQYGTDINDRMVSYSQRNLEWISKSKTQFSRAASGRPVATGGQRSSSPCQAPDSLEKSSFLICQGDATSFTWEQPIDAVAFEGFLGQPMSLPPAEIKLKAEKQTCSSIILGFLKNLAPQIKAETPVVMAIPAWLRENGRYSRLDILDEVEKLGYNLMNRSRDGLLYFREGQVVARDIIILRKK